MFYRYKPEEDGTKVLLIYLILGGYLDDGGAEIKRLEEVEEDRSFGLKLRKTYGVTDFYIDKKEIEREIEAIENPIICSPLSYEYYADSERIYVYSPKDAGSGEKFVINDMGVISKTMIITRSMVVSDRLAGDCALGAGTCGFMFFMNYVLEGRFSLLKWHISYENSVFTIAYGKPEDVIYEAIEIDKTSTYKIVIYIIRKVSPQIPEWQPDCYYVTKYREDKENE